MADPTTSNKGLLLIANGSASGTWGTILNASVFTIVDQALGNTVSVAVSSSDVALTTTQVQNLAVKLTGSLSNSLNVTLPLNPNSTSAAVGGFSIFENDTTGAFTVTVKTVASGSTGVAVPQGTRSLLYSDGTNITFADDAQNQRQVYAGNPNGNVAGNAPGVATRASLVVNSSTNETYMATSSGTAGSAVWHKNLPYSFPSEGYLTLSSDATNPILTGDSIGATTLYCTAFRGDQMWVNNGTSFVPVTITGGQIAVPLSATFQVANGIYDAVGFLSTTGIVRVGLSPIWSTLTEGAGARGTGAGTPQLSRVSGILVNTVAQTVNNGSNQFTVAANRGTYLGSIAIDGTAGQVTCHVTFGKSRKWGVWNAYNRQPLFCQVGDNTASWNNTGSWGPSNNSTGNAALTLCGLPEEPIAVKFNQMGQAADGSGQIAIGANSTTSPSGNYGFVLSPSGTVGNIGASLSAGYQFPPALGTQRITCMEKGGSNITMFGNTSGMLMTAAWYG